MKSYLLPLLVSVGMLSAAFAVTVQAMTIIPDPVTGKTYVLSDALGGILLATLCGTFAMTRGDTSWRQITVVVVLLPLGCAIFAMVQPR